MDDLGSLLQQLARAPVDGRLASMSDDVAAQGVMRRRQARFDAQSLGLAALIAVCVGFAGAAPWKMAPRNDEVVLNAPPALAPSRLLSFDI
jgi:hypothetical protein